MTVGLPHDGTGNGSIIIWLIPLIGLTYFGRSIVLCTAWVDTFDRMRWNWAVLFSPLAGLDPSGIATLGSGMRCQLNVRVGWLFEF